VRARSLTIAFCLLANGAISFAAESPPACRLDDRHAAIVQSTLQRSLSAYMARGADLKIRRVVVNPSKPIEGGDVLRVYLVKDRTASSVDARGCSEADPVDDDPLDAISVPGGCVTDGRDKPEIRCSAQAINLFADVGTRSDRENPTLLYVLSHELGHIRQRRFGEYSGRTERIRLDAAPTEKLALLRKSCEPAWVKAEEQADDDAISAMTRLLHVAPYRENVLSQRGSMLWNVDLIALTVEKWKQFSFTRELARQSAVHTAFKPKEFPTPKATVRANARSFMCAVFRGRKGVINYPARSATHPPAEQRLRKIAERFRASAGELPDAGSSTDFAPIVELQEGLSPLLNHIYQGTAEYMEAVQDEICTLVNSEQPFGFCG
jgi:hypothetical protein